MTSEHTRQQKNDLKAKVVALLMQLKSNFGFNGRALAERLGINENYLSRVYRGKVEGSRQLFCGLSLLLELETLKRKPEPKSIEERLSELSEQIQEMKSGKYPERRGHHLAMNEPTPSPTSPPRPTKPQAPADQPHHPMAEETMKLVDLAERQVEADKVIQHPPRARKSKRQAP